MPTVELLNTVRLYRPVGKGAACKAREPDFLEEGEDIEFVVPTEIEKREFDHNMHEFVRIRFRDNLGMWQEALVKRERVLFELELAQIGAE